MGMRMVKVMGMRKGMRMGKRLQCDKMRCGAMQCDDTIRCDVMLRCDGTRCAAM